MTEEIEIMGQDPLSMLADGNGHLSPGTDDDMQHRSDDPPLPPPPPPEDGDDVIRKGE